MVPSHAAALQLFVNRLSSRSILTEEEVSAVLSLNGQVKQLAAHTDFVPQGQQVDHTCLVVEGIVGRFGQNGEGARQITCLYVRGDMADLPTVVSPKSAWGLSALTRATILRVPHVSLRHIAAEHSGVAEAFWRDCVADGSLFSEWLVNVGRRGALNRLAHLLCEMAIRSERAGQGDRYSFPLALTQTDLGDATGLTSVHINRTLKDLKSRSVITMIRGTVTIVDWDHLVALGDFNDAFMILDGPPLRISATP